MTSSPSFSFLSLCSMFSVCGRTHLYLPYQPMFYTPIYLPIFLSFHQSFSLSLSFYLSIYLSVCPSIYLSIYLSMCLSIYLSIYLPNYRVYPLPLSVSLILLTGCTFHFRKCLSDSSLVGVGFDTKGTGLVTVKGTSITRAPVIHTVADSREGWVEALRLSLSSHFHGTAPVVCLHSEVEKCSFLHS